MGVGQLCEGGITFVLQRGLDSVARDKTSINFSEVRMPSTRG